MHKNIDYGAQSEDAQHDIYRVESYIVQNDRKKK